MIHKALRAMLYDTAMSLQQTDFSDADAMEPVLQDLETIIHAYDDHADHEDTHVLGIAAAVNPALAASFEEEHITDRQLGANLSNAIESYTTSSDAPGRLRAGHHIFYAYNAFIAFNLTHMNKEENELNEVLWAQCTDVEIQAINSKIASAIPPDQAAQNFTWMMRSCNNTELAGFLRSIKANAQPPVINMVNAIAEKELSPARWSLLQEALNPSETPVA
jgi:hypothetical protein